MIKENEIQESLQRLIDYIEREEYSGYDPYDTLNTVLPVRMFGNWPSVIATQVQKRNPVNIRPLLGIKKGVNPKALGLILHAYTILQKQFPESNFSSQMKFLIGKIGETKSKGNSGNAWGYNFAWAGPGKYLPAYAPNVVVTSFIAKGLFASYEISRDEETKKMLAGIAQFIEADLPVTETKDGICFSYTPFMTDCCYNASLLAAETLARVYTITGDEKQKSKAISAVEFVIAHQHADGHWEYKIDIDTGKERHQVDFHQGYIIDSISAVMKYTGENNSRFTDAIKKGAEFYRQKQFFADGRSLWRLPKEYPVEIHNQSQGIITFSRLAGTIEGSLEFATTIADWTIRNMQNEDGHFSYRKLKNYTNKISFMRWSNAWMMLALAELLQGGKK